MHVEGDAELLKIDTRMKKGIQSLIKQARNRDEITSDLPVKWLVAFFDSTFTAGWALVSSNSLSPKKAAIYAKETFFNGCSR